MIRELNTASFKEFIQESEYAVVDCYGDFCFACELLEPVLNTLAAKLPGVDFARINVTQNFDLAAEMQIFDLPTVLYYRRGQLMTTSTGSIGEEDLKPYIAEMLYGKE